MLCFQGSGNEQDDTPIVENETPNPVESSSDINNVRYDEESQGTAAMEANNQGGPPTGRKRKAKATEVTEKRMDEAYTLLKKVANKPKADKDESSLFCDLLCLKLKALDDNTREIAMHEINNLLFNLKKPNIQQPYWSYPRNNQPGYFTNTVPLSRSVTPIMSPVDVSQHSFSSCGSVGNNPVATNTQQCSSDDSQIEIPCRSVAEYVQNFNI